MTPAEEIQTAATKLRALAETAQRDLETADYWKPYATDAWAHGFINGFGGPGSDYVAVLPPAAGLALAKWLESWTGIDLYEAGSLPEDLRHALAVARAINGSEQP